MSTRGRRIASSAVVLFLIVTSALAADPPRQTLAPTGKLRGAFYPGGPTSILDPNEAEPRGIGYQLGKALASKLGVPYEPIVYKSNVEVQEALKGGNADFALTNASPARQKEMDFGPIVLVSELGYLVPAGSTLKSSADVDQKGRRIGVAVGSTSQASLSQELKNAELVATPTVAAGAELLISGKLDAFATSKAALFEMGKNVPGSQVLPDRWGQENYAIAIPKGREQGVAFVKEFTEEALASGLVKAAMDRSGIKGAVTAGK